VREEKAEANPEAEIKPEADGDAIAQ